MFEFQITSIIFHSTLYLQIQSPDIGRDTVSYLISFYFRRRKICSIKNL